VRRGASLDPNQTFWQFLEERQDGARFNWRRMSTWPAASTPWTWKTDLAMSRPIVVTTCMSGSCESWGLNSTHIHGTHVPVEEPSTASKADIELS
jgi:hypothetical protein